MDRIVLEVNNKIAKAWREAPLQFREVFERDIEVLLSEKIREAEKDDFKQALNDMRKNATANGMTQEILEKLLSED
jgi:hypothetical protein